MLIIVMMMMIIVTSKVIDYDHRSSCQNQHHLAIAIITIIIAYCDHQLIVVIITIVKS